MKRLPLLLALAGLLCAGCVHSSTRDRRGGLSAMSGDNRDGEDFGVVATLFADGRIELFGHPVSRETLAERLLEEEGGAVGERMVVLRGRDGVTRGQLEALKDYLLARRIYRVTIATPRTASSSALRYAPILPDGRLEAQDLSPDDPIARALDE